MLRWFLSVGQEEVDVPANRRPVDREAKRDEIVQAAARLFTEAGFDATPMTQLAAAAGVTTNTV